MGRRLLAEERSERSQGLQLPVARGRPCDDPEQGVCEPCFDQREMDDGVFLVRDGDGIP